MIPETNKGQAQLYRIDQPGKRLCRHLEMSNDIISLKISVSFLLQITLYCYDKISTLDYTLIIIYYSQLSLRRTPLRPALSVHLREVSVL